MLREGPRQHRNIEQDSAKFCCLELFYRGQLQLSALGPRYQQLNRHSSASSTISKVSTCKDPRRAGACTLSMRSGAFTTTRGPPRVRGWSLEGVTIASMTPERASSWTEVAGRRRRRTETDISVGIRPVLHRFYIVRNRGEFGQVGIGHASGEHPLTTPNVPDDGAWPYQPVAAAAARERLALAWGQTASPDPRGDRVAVQARSGSDFGDPDEHTPG